MQIDDQRIAQIYRDSTARKSQSCFNDNKHQPIIDVLTDILTQIDDETSRITISNKIRELQFKG